MNEKGEGHTLNHKQRALRFVELHGERLIVRRTIRNKTRTSHLPVRIKEVLLTVPYDVKPVVLFTWTKRKPEPNWLKVWAQAIELLGPVETFEVPIEG